MLDLAAFRLWFPEFSAVTDATVNFWITRSLPHFDVARWDDLLEEGQAQWVAHNVSEQVTAAASGAGASNEFGAIKLRAGDTEITYSDSAVQAQVSAGPYGRTTYGQRYLDLVRQVGTGALAV